MTYKKLPKQFIDTLLFCTEKEAQARVNKYYPGWKVKVSEGNVGLIYDPDGNLAHKILPERNKELNKIFDILERRFL